MTKISEPIECLSASIFSKIDDDDFKTLKAIFTASGRGRRPSMPNLCLNNKLLLQLYFLKDDGTWNDLLDFAVYYIDIQKSRIKGLLLKVYKEVLTVKEEDHISYLANEVTFVGKYLLRFSITRHELLGDISNKKTVPVAVTNGILLDLIQFQKREDLLVSWIPQAVSYLSGDYSNQLCQKQIKNITTIAKKKSQNRSRDPVGYETFMSCKVFDGIESALLSSPNVCNIRIETETSPHTPICPTPKTPCRKRIKLDSISEDEKTNNENSPLLSASKAVQIRKIKGQLESAVVELQVEKENNRTLQQLLTERMRKMKSEEEKTNVLLNKNEKDIVHLKEELNKTRQQVEDRNKIISSIRQAPFYKRMKRWEENLREKEQEMTKDQQCKAKKNRTVQILKKKLKKTQTLLSNLRATNNKVKSEKLNLFDRIDQLEKEFLKDQKHPPIIMRDQNSNKFTNSVILCVMELIGKCEVSGKNCSAVIDVVSRHLFDVHIKEKDLPSERTSLRFADKGHILAQHQIADTLLHSSNVDLHSDGTSRDHNKVLGHQFSTNDGKILSCGFAPVFKEDTDTLVDVAFNMLKELADVYDGNEADAAFKVMLKNITGLMSDRASVMKSFDKSFNLKRQQTLHTDEDLEFLHCNAHFLLGLSSASEKILRSWSWAG